MIVQLTKEQIADVNTPKQPYPLIGKLALTFQNGVWHAEELLADEGIQKYDPNYDGAAIEDYIDNPDRAIFLAYENEKCVGQVFVARAWNAYAHIEDLAVAVDFRGKGVGTALFKKAAEWGMKNHLCGLSLECQDVNLLASRFCKKMGMRIGGVNTDLYRHLGKPFDEEIAVFWYLDFDQDALVQASADAILARYAAAFRKLADC